VAGWGALASVVVACCSVIALGVSLITAHRQNRSEGDSSEREGRLVVATELIAQAAFSVVEKEQQVSLAFLAYKRGRSVSGDGLTIVTGERTVVYVENRGPGDALGLRVSASAIVGGRPSDDAIQSRCFERLRGVWAQGVDRVKIATFPGVNLQNPNTCIRVELEWRGQANGALGRRVEEIARYERE
jgi:hypothetical protein